MAEGKTEKGRKRAGGEFRGTRKWKPAARISKEEEASLGTSWEGSERRLRRNSGWRFPSYHALPSFSFPSSFLPPFSCAILLIPSPFFHSFFFLFFIRPRPPLVFIRPRFSSPLSLPLALLSFPSPSPLVFYHSSSPIFSPPTDA